MTGSPLQPTRPEIERHLDAVLDTQGFRDAPVLRKLLRALCDATMKGQHLDVWDLTETVYGDASESAYNRTKAGVSKLRKALAECYQTQDQDFSIRLVIPLKQYRVEVEPAPPRSHPTGPTATTNRRAWIWVVALVGVALVAVIATLTTNTAVLEPVDHIVLTNDGIAALSASDETIWTDRFLIEKKQYEARGNLKRNWYIITDVDADDRQDTFFIYRPPSAAEVPESLVRYDDQGKEVWRYTEVPQLSVPGRYFAPVFRSKFAGTFAIDDRIYLILISEHYSHYPTFVSLIDAETGTSGPRFYNPGRVYSAAMCDIDDDGLDELLIGGANNPGKGLGHAFLAALDLPLTAGQDGKVFPIRYALFARPISSVVEEHLPTIQVVQCLENGIKVTRDDNEETTYTFMDYNFRALEAVPADGLKSFYGRLFRTRSIPFPLDDDEAQRLARILLFDSPPDGNSPKIAEAFGEWWLGVDPKDWHETRAKQQQRTTASAP